MKSFCSYSFRMTILQKSVSVWNEIKKIKSRCQHKYPYGELGVTGETDGSIQKVTGGI